MDFENKNASFAGEEESSSSREEVPEDAEEETDTELLNSPRRIGTLSDYYDDEKRGSQFYENLETTRNPEDKIDVAVEREEIDNKLGEVTKLIESEEAKEHPLSAARGELGIKHSDGEALSKLKEAKKKLEEQKHDIELAGQFNEVLDGFGDMSSEERAHIAETGKNLKGESLRDTYGNKIRSDVAKELAHLYQKGGRHVTWGQLKKLGKVAERILLDVTTALKDTVKSIFGGKTSERRGVEGEEQAHAE